MEWSTKCWWKSPYSLACTGLAPCRVEAFYWSTIARKILTNDNLRKEILPPVACCCSTMSPVWYRRWIYPSCLSCNVAYRRNLVKVDLAIWSCIGASNDLNSAVHSWGLRLFQKWGKILWKMMIQAILWSTWKKKKCRDFNQRRSRWRTFFTSLSQELPMGGVSWQRVVSNEFIGHLN